MRDRHKPRLCRSCEAPMARQENSCWRCGRQWGTADAATLAARDTPRDDDTTCQAERWIDDGGNWPREHAGQPQVAPRR